MLTAIIVGILGLAGIAALSKYQSGKNRQKELKMAQDATLALEAQRFEKLREILTDGVIDGNPAAVEVLKPIAGVIAEQLGGEKEIERKKLEHQYRLEEIKAKSGPELSAIEARKEPLRIWNEQVKMLWKQTGDHYFGKEGVPAFEKGLKALQEAWFTTFPGLQLPAPAPPKMLTEGDEGTDEKDDE